MRKGRGSFGKLPTTGAERLMLPLLLFATLPLVGCQLGGAAAHPTAGDLPILSAPSATRIQLTRTEYPPQQPARELPAATELPAPAPLTLEECVRMALARQPRVASQRTSLAAAEDAKRAIDALRVPVSLVPDLPYRRQQFGLGVLSAAAGLDQAERETVYAVTRTYCTVLYARQQEGVARGVVERLQATREAAQQALEAGAREATSADVNRTLVYIRLAQTQQTQAEQGVKRALVALREAIGLGPAVVLNVPSRRLPEPEIKPSREEVVRAALARRGDLAQAGVFAQLTCLEVDAQASNTHKRKMDTFFRGSDIHAVQVPQGTHNSEYRPGGILPEMPPVLVGSQAERVQHAQSLMARAETVVETTRNLIALEAEDAFLRWEEEARKASQAREAVTVGDKLADDLRKDFTSGQKVRVEDVITAQVLAAQARSQYNEFVYRQLLALADLERITAGGFCAGLVELVDGKPREKKDRKGEADNEEAPEPKKTHKDDEASEKVRP